MGLTEHGLQSDQTGDKVVKVDSHVCLCVAQDDQLEQMVCQLESWRTARDRKPEEAKKNINKSQKEASLYLETGMQESRHMCVVFGKMSDSCIFSHLYWNEKQAKRFLNL